MPRPAYARRVQRALRVQYGKSARDREETR